MNETATAKLDWRVLLAFWAVVATLLAVRAVLTLPHMSLYGDHDDVMRLVTASDLLHGQPWQDTIQHRDDAPFGSQMHWSRLVDAPLALLMAPFAPPLAHHVAAIAWPLLLMLPMLALCATIILRLVPTVGQVTAIALPVVTLAILIEFMPGRVDHHNVQVVLALVVLLALLAGRDRIIGAIVAGVAMATSLAIGLETLLVAVTAAACYALLWTWHPARYRRPLIAFGAALLLGAGAHFLIATSPMRYAEFACDMLSPVQLTALALGVAALVAAAIIGSRFASYWQRFALLAVGGAVALGLTQLWFPGCLFSPYSSLPSEMSEVLFSTIKEVQSLWTRLSMDPATGVAFALPILIAVPVTAWNAWRGRGETRVDWLITFAFLITSAVVMLVQMRGARIAAPFALPAAASVIVLARAAYLRSPVLMNALKMVGAWVLFAGILQFAAISGLATLLTPQSATASATTALPREMVEKAFTILLPPAWATLAALPPGSVMAPPAIDVYVLLNTPHSVVSLGFHRNIQGYMDMRTFMAGNDEAAARDIAEKRGLDYVLTYDGIEGFEAIATWPWLELVSPPDEPIHIYRVNL